MIRYLIMSIAVWAWIVMAGVHPYAWAVEEASEYKIVPSESLELEGLEEASSEEEEEELFGWDKYPPIVVSEWWDPKTTRITVKMDEELEGEELLAVKRIRLQTLGGVTIGTKGFYPHEKIREAEFNTNHQMLEDDVLVIQVMHPGFGVWERQVRVRKNRHDPAPALVELDLEDADSDAADNPVAKKKSWFW